MGGELEKSTLQQKTNKKLDGKSKKNKLEPMATDENISPNKKKASKSAIKTTYNNNETKRDKLKKERENFSSLKRKRRKKSRKKSIRINSRKKRRKGRLRFNLQYNQ